MRWSADCSCSRKRDTYANVLAPSFSIRAKHKLSTFRSASSRNFLGDFHLRLKVQIVLLGIENRGESQQNYCRKSSKADSRLICIVSPKRFHLIFSRNANTKPIFSQLDLLTRFIVNYRRDQNNGSSQLFDTTSSVLPLTRSNGIIEVSKTFSIVNRVKLKTVTEHCVLSISSVKFI